MPMEGGWMRLGAVAWLAICCAAFASGCGDDATAPAAQDGADVVRTKAPERAFAPLVLLDSREPWRPMSGRWFIENSVLWFADDRGCGDRKVAVGRALPERRSEDRSDVDWIYPLALGTGELAYYRNPYEAGCELNWEIRHRADQLTRPQDQSRARRAELGPGEGFYLDLVDEARAGPRTLGDTPVYYERKDEGDGQVRLTYWMLFGMDDGGQAGDDNDRHEGDWERVDVLLAHDGADGYSPRAVQLDARAAEPSDILWDRFALSDGHPVVRSARGSHALAPEAPGESCADCLPWPTWRTLSDARAQHWYGFGGAWGEPGSTDETTGPLGPHGPWGVHPQDPG